MNSLAIKKQLSTVAFLLHISMTLSNIGSPQMALPVIKPVSHRWPGVVVGRLDEIDTGKEEDRSQQSIHNQAFYLSLGATGFHKNDGKIDQSGNTQYGENYAEYTLYIHTTLFT